ncbi:MAG: lycopene cyclase [Roseivirga sp.]|nr:lycopene cyclase [Roseivirga sp.]
MTQFDYIIAGGGGAGLTLAFLLMGDKNTKKSTLIIERDSKDLNDRTWCFWEKGDNLLEELVYKSWNQAHFESDDYREIFQLAPYRYKMIRGLDFYQFMKTELAKHTEITWLQADVTMVHDDGKVDTSEGRYQANMVFDSTKPLSSFNDIDTSTTLMQHFKGYFIKTSKSAFDPEVFSYMDFRLPQQGDFRFGYILPFSEKEALVEYTLFNQHLLTDDAYQKGLETYLHEVLKITDYEVIEEEYGVIPMTDYSFPFRVSDHVFRIGISGGFAKPSTGYTFLRGQKILAKVVKNISKGLPADQALPFQKSRFKKYDSTLLNVLSKTDNKGRESFTDMFRKNGMQRMFRFLDEETNLQEELAIMSSTPIFTFGKAFIESITKRSK